LYDVNITNAAFGTTRNPWQVNCTADGSSGGNRSVLAVPIAPVGLVKELSKLTCIQPVFNDLAGIRPALKWVVFYPTEFDWDTFVAYVQGAVARSVADVRLMLSILAKPDDRDPMPLSEHRFDLSRQPAR
jgi:amidase